MRETFELMRERDGPSGHGMLPAGIVLTGGGAQLAGVAELGREVLQMPVRIAAPAGIGGLVDNLLTPGLLGRGRPAAVGRRASSRPARPCATSRPRRCGGLGRIRDAIRSIFP